MSRQLMSPPRTPPPPASAKKGKKEMRRENFASPSPVRFVGNPKVEYEDLPPAMVQHYAILSRTKLEKLEKAFKKDGQELDTRRFDLCGEKSEKLAKLAMLEQKERETDDLLTAIRAEKAQVILDLQEDNVSLNKNRDSTSEARTHLTVIGYLLRYDKDKRYAKLSLLAIQDDMELPTLQDVMELNYDQCFQVLNKLKNLGLGENDEFIDDSVLTWKGDADLDVAQARIIRYLNVHQTRLPAPPAAASIPFATAAATTTMGGNENRPPMAAAYHPAMAAAAAAAAVAPSAGTGEDDDDDEDIDAQIARLLQKKEMQKRKKQRLN